MSKARGGDGAKALRETIRRYPQVTARISQESHLALMLVAYREQTSVARLLSHAIDQFLTRTLTEANGPSDPITRRRQPEKAAEDQGVPYNKGAHRRQVGILLSDEEIEKLTQEASRRGISRSAYIAGLLSSHPDIKLGGTNAQNR